MKKVFIDSKRKIVVVNGKQIPRLLLRIIKGGVGKLFVVKHYSGRGIVVTRFPDMSGIVASEKQRERRDLFREAVVYAQWIIGDEERKKAFRKTLPRKKQKHVYQAAIQLYMSMKGDQQWLRKQLAVKAMLSIRGEGRLVREQEEKATGNKQLEVKAEDKLVKDMNGQWSIMKVTIRKNYYTIRKKDDYVT